MRKLWVIGFSALLFFSTAYYEQTQAEVERYQTLRTSKPLILNENYHLEIVSRVDMPNNALQSSAERLIVALQKMNGALTGMDNDTNVYLYTYSFYNQSPYPIKVHLSGFEFMVTAFKDVVQDFALYLNPNETRVIRFLATGKPVLHNPGVVVGIFKQTRSDVVLQDLYGEGPSWSFLGTGFTSVWAAPWNGLHLVVH